MVNEHAKIPSWVAPVISTRKMSEEHPKEQDFVSGEAGEDSSKIMPSSQQEEEVVKKKYGGIMPKKPPLISKDHERAYFDSADWALGKQGGAKPKGPLEALRPKLQMKQIVEEKSSESPLNSKHGTGDHLMHQQMSQITATFIKH
ncbi:hypothetical protein V2J09_013234 [Rumex salicifolius]